jgi:hypothetical protein
MVDPDFTPLHTITIGSVLKLTKGEIIFPSFDSREVEITHASFSGYRIK